MIPSQQVYFLSGSVHPAEPVFCPLVERSVRPMSWAVRHLQIKWVKGSGKAGKRFMGGESFLGAGAGDGVGEGLGVGKRSREASEESARFGEPKVKAAAGVPGRGCSPQRRGACGELRPPLCPSTPWRRGNVITGLIFRIAPQLPLDHAATPLRPRRDPTCDGASLGVGEVASFAPRSLGPSHRATSQSWRFVKNACVGWVGLL